VFAKWLSDLFGVTKRPVRMFSSREGALWPTRGLGTVVSVCATCNNRWMSDLEDATQARFSAAVLGEPSTFTAPDLTTLAHWAAKTALMLQPHLAGMGEVTHIPTGHLSALPHGTPSGTRVWLGAYGPLTRYVYWQHVPMEFASEPRTNRWTGYATLMTVGHILLVILGLDAEHGDDFTVEGMPGVAFRPVWPLPVEPVRWPDGLILNDTGIATFWPPKSRGLVVRSA
jgi:hypothetical protein